LVVVIAVSIVVVLVVVPAVLGYFVVLFFAVSFESG
jgi:hypothetical protein